MNIDLCKLENDVKEAIAMSAFVEVEVLEFLSKDESCFVRSKVATNPNLTDTILDRLSKDDDPCVRIEVAKNPSTSSEILDFLSRDKNDEVRFEVARNENTLSKTLDYLSYDEHPVIRRNVAINKNTSPVTLVLLVIGECDFGVKYFVAHNSNVPEDVRENLKNSLPYNVGAQTPDIQMLRDYYDEDEDDWD